MVVTSANRRLHNFALFLRQKTVMMSAMGIYQQSWGGLVCPTLKLKKPAAVTCVGPFLLGDAVSLCFSRGRLDRKSFPETQEPKTIAHPEGD
jgi:hypothetical protein